MTTYIAMRCNVHGITQYHFYNTNNLTKVGYVIPIKHTVMLRSRHIKYRYVHDPDITTVPGCSQVVYPEDSSDEYARIFWDGLGKHRIQTSDGTFDVTYQNGTYSFSWKGFHFADMAPYREGTPFSHPLCENLPPDKEPCMIMQTNTEPPVGLALLMLSFPILQIRP